MKNYKRILASLGMAGVLSLAITAPAFAAEDTANMEVGITAGDLTITLTDPVFANDDLTYSVSSQTVTTDGGTAAQLTVEDLTGSGDGWTVTAQSAGLSSGSDSIGADAINVTPGNVVSADGATPGSGGTLDQDREVLVAAPGNGDGTSTADLDVEITVPASQAPGTYAGTLVVTTTPTEP